MSAMDAVTSIEDYIALASSLGHTAVGLTDHGCVQAFPAAQQASKKAKIKMLYGAELYVVDKHLDNIYNNFSKKVPYPSLTIRKMKTRWGVCNKKLQKVTLNYNLIYMDTKYLDYVIVHELSHFIHFDHSKSFWSLVEENEPNDEAAYRELFEETGISSNDIELDHFMDLNYFKYENNLQVYYGILKNEVTLVEEKNKLEWVTINEELLNNEKFAGNYNIPHIIKQIKVYLRDGIKY